MAVVGFTSLLCEKCMERTVKNLIYNSGYQILAIIIPLITTPYLARVIGANGIGQYSFANSITYYFVMFIMLGLNNYGNRTIASVRDDHQSLKTAFSEIYCMQLIVGIIVSFLYILFCCLFYRNSLIQWIFFIYIITAVVDINWLFFGLEKFRITATRNAIIKIFITASIFIFVKSENDLVIYIILSLCGTLISNLILWPFALKQVGIVRVDILESIKHHLIPNLVLFIPIVAVSLYKYMDKIMLGYMSNTEQVGFYEYSEKIILIPIALVNSLGIVMLPKMSNLVATHKSESEKTYISYSIIFASMLSSSMCFGIMGLAKEFVPFFYGKGFDACTLLYYILLPSCCFIAFSNIIRTQYLIPHKLDRIYIKSVILGAVVNLVANYLLIWKFQAAGAAIGTLLAEIVVCVYQGIAVRAYVDIKQYVFDSIPFFAAGILMFCCLYYLPVSRTITVQIITIKVLVGFVTYIVFLMIFLLFRKDELNRLMCILRRFLKIRKDT